MARDAPVAGSPQRDTHAHTGNVVADADAAVFTPVTVGFVVGHFHHLFVLALCT